MEVQGQGENEGENLSVRCPVSNCGHLSCLRENSVGSIAHQLITPPESSFPPLGKFYLLLLQDSGKAQETW